MTINEAQDEVIEEFSDFTDWMDKYQLLIDLGNEQQPLDQKYKTEDNLIDGCQSRVWLQADYRDGRIYFTAESDALIVKGIIALLIRVLSGHTPQEILDAECDGIVQAAHIKPHHKGGSDKLTNGLWLCEKHHRMTEGKLTGSRDLEHIDVKYRP